MIGVKKDTERMVEQAAAPEAGTRADSLAAGRRCAFDADIGGSVIDSAYGYRLQRPRA